MMRSRRANTVNRASETNPVQTLTLTGASGTYTTAKVRSWGFTRIDTTAATGAGWAVQLQQAPRAGITKIITINSASTVPVTIYPYSTAGGFIGGTTANLINSTTGTNLRDRAIILMSVSSTAWALVHVTTGITLNAATTSPF